LTPFFGEQYDWKVTSRNFVKIIIFLYLFFLLQCGNNGGAANTITADRNGALIPFVEYDSAGEEKWGYLDENTGEVAIKAQYNYAFPFIGGFAVVSHEDRRIGEIIINRNGKRVNVGKFDEAYLFASESGKNAMAVLENRYKRTKFDSGFNLFGPNDSPHFYKEDYYKYRLVNLVTGKTIIPPKENYLEYGIEVAGDYFLVESDTLEYDLYQFLDNGDVKLAAKNNPKLAAEILTKYFETRGINAAVEEKTYDVDIDYRPYVEKVFANPPDFNAVLKDLPPELIFKEAKPFYRDHRRLLNAPLEITEIKYRVYFDVKDADFSAEGLYDEAKAKWEIPPFFNINFSDTKGIELYYTNEIRATNNPHLYYVSFTNEEIRKVGWNAYAQIGGGLYSLIENDYLTKGFMGDLYLAGEYPDMERNKILLGYSGGQESKFPNRGVYYRDYSRVKDKRD